jgi:DMSO/TMAO reductase YedYZ molybdopterin-dependent catalytic subunit
MHRRGLLRAGVLTGFALLTEQAFAQSAPDKILPWADQPSPVPPPAQDVVRNITPWESLDSWITPNNKFFSIAHYNRPTIDSAAWRLNLSGLLNPTALSLDQLKAAPRQEVTFTLECSGNNGLPFAQSMIGNRVGARIDCRLWLALSGACQRIRVETGIPRPVIRLSTLHPSFASVR